MAKTTSLSSQSIKYKLVIAVCLMSIIPLLVCLNYIFPSFFTSAITGANFPLIIFITLLMIILGVIIIKQVIDPVVKLSQEAQLIAKGDCAKQIDIRSEDEVGQLGKALNQLTRKIRENMDELKNYGSKTAQVNLEIQKRIIFMSTLLHISDLIAQGEKIDTTLALCVEKVKDMADSSAAFILFLEEGLYSLKAQWGLSKDAQAKAVFSGHNVNLAQMFEKDTPTVIDAKNQKTSNQRFLAAFDIKNFLGVSICSFQKPIALLGIGNCATDFTYDRDDIELLSIFGKQIAIAIENNGMMQRLEKLEIKDMLTGLYNEHYIRNRLDEEIKRAILYQRPCAFILAKINNFTEYQQSYGLIAAEAILKKIAACLSSLFSGVECLGRFADYEFAIILPEKNKRQTQKTAEELQKEVENIFKHEVDSGKRFSISVAVAENPLDGVSSRELISSAQRVLDTRKA